MAADTIGKFGSDYLRLGLRIGRHQEDYVDYYYGPPEIKENVDKEPKIHPKQLHKDCSSLQKEVFDQGFDAKREIYLEKMLKAMEVTIERDLLKKEKRSVEEDFKRQNAMEFRPFEESLLEGLKVGFDEAYGGTGTLSKRMATMRKKRALPKTEVYDACQKGLNIAKKRTQELYPGMLPEEEDIKVIVSSKCEWGAYDWYKGNFKSTMEINSKTAYWTGLLRIGTHEGYPGHHTAFVVAEEKLYLKKNQFEHAILLYNTPYMIIVEGIADVGVNTLFSYLEQEDIALREFCPDQKNGPSIEELVQQNMVRKNISMIDFNATYHKLVEKWSDEEVIKYLTSFEIFGDEICKRMLNRMKNPALIMVATARQLGRDVIIEALGEYPSPKDFRRLLENPVLPSDLRSL